MEIYMTAKEVAAKVRLSEQSIRRYTMLGQIPFHRIVRAVRYKESEIEKWVEDRGAGQIRSKATEPVIDLFDEAGSGASIGGEV
jgi:excisionase family DNA binding protein